MRNNFMPSTNLRMLSRVVSVLLAGAFVGQVAGCSECDGDCASPRITLGVTLTDVGPAFAGTVTASYGQVRVECPRPAVGYSTRVSCGPTGFELEMEDTGFVRLEIGAGGKVYTGTISPEFHDLPSGNACCANSRAATAIVGAK